MNHHKASVLERSIWRQIKQLHDPDDPEDSTVEILAVLGTVYTKMAKKIIDQPAYREMLIADLEHLTREIKLLYGIEARSIVPSRN